MGSDEGLHDRITGEKYSEEEIDEEILDLLGKNYKEIAENAMDAILDPETDELAEEIAELTFEIEVEARPE
jgi:hypothetical protein